MILKIIGLFLAWVLRIVLFLASIYYVYSGDIVSAITLLASFAFTLLPVIIRRVYSVDLHWIYDFIFSIFISGHMIGFMGMYERWLLYDDILHILGSFIVGITGFSVFYAFDHTKRIRITAPILFLLTLMWTISVGAVWEIMEFMWDNIVFLSAGFGFAQDSLLDTMIDLSWDFIAGILAALAMATFCKKSSERLKKQVFDPIVKLFSKKTIDI
jgi:hypothetical protein